MMKLVLVPEIAGVMQLDVWALQVKEVQVLCFAELCQLFRT